MNTITKQLSNMMNKLNKIEKETKPMAGGRPSGKKKKGNNQKSKRRGVSSMISTGINHVKTATDVLATFVTPHDRAKATVAGLPTYPNDKSQKCEISQEFDVVVGTNFTGYIGITPTLAYDVNAIIYSNATTFVSTTVQALNSGATGTTTSAMNLAYASASLGQNLEARIVSIGLEWHYYSSFNNCGGGYYAYSHPRWASLVGMSASDMASNASCLTNPTEMGEICHYTSAIPDPSFAAYGITAQPLGAAAVPIALWFQGASGTSFKVRVHFIVEYTGKTSDPVATQNPIPPAGLLDHAIMIAHKVKEAHCTHKRVSTGQLLNHAKHLYSLASHVKVGGVPITTTAARVARSGLQALMSSAL